MPLPLRGMIPNPLQEQNGMRDEPGSAMVVVSADIPWLAIAFKQGQQDRLSPSCGDLYSGQYPP